MTHQTIQTAQAIAAAIIATSYPLQMEDVGPNSERDFDSAAYDGVMIFRDGGDQVAHIYLMDDEPEAPAWMIDLVDLRTAESNPEPMTLAALNKIGAWVEG